VATSVYTQRNQDRLQRVASEITKRETVYADFVMSASNFLLTAYTEDKIVLTGDKKRLIGLVNRMRFFAPLLIVAAAETVFKAMIEIALKPGVELQQFAKESLSKSPYPDPLLEFSQLCRADLENVRRTMV